MRTRTLEPVLPLVSRGRRAASRGPPRARASLAGERGEHTRRRGVGLPPAGRLDRLAHETAESAIARCRRARAREVRVEPSTSVKRKVTVPVGSAFTTRECIHGVLGVPAGSRLRPPSRRPTGLSTLERPVESGDAVDEATQAGAGRRVGAADTVVGHRHAEHAVRSSRPRPERTMPARTWRRS